MSSLASGARRKSILRRFSLGVAGINGVLGTLGVAIGVANIIALISVTETGRWQALGVLRDAGSDTVFVTNYINGEDGGVEQMRTSMWLPEKYADAIRALPEVDAVAPVLMMPGHVGAGAQRVFITIQGVNSDYIPVRGHKVDRGRFFSDGEQAAAGRVVCLGSEAATKLFGETDAVGQQVVLKGQRFEVIGVMVPKGMIGFENFDLRAFVPLKTAQELYEIPGVHTILTRAARGVDPNDAAKAIRAALRVEQGAAEGEPDDFTVATVEELTGILDRVLKVFRWMMLGIGSVAMVVAGIGIMNVMLMQVIERTREIGVRRAVGARRLDIWRQFLIEAVTQTFIGALVGIGLGVAGSLVFCAIVDWQLKLSAGTVLVATAFSIVTGILFGVYPAIQASQLKPIDCLRYE